MKQTEAEKAHKHASRQLPNLQKSWKKDHIVVSEM